MTFIFDRMRKVSSDIFRMTAEEKRDLKLRLDCLVGRCCRLIKLIHELHSDPGEEKGRNETQKKIKDLIENAS